MAHPVPTDGDTVEVDAGGTTERGTVTEAIGSFARIETESGDSVEAKHDSVADDHEKSYRFVDAEAEVSEEGNDEADDESDAEEADEADESEAAALDPTEMTVEEIEEAVEDADDETIEAALEAEEATDDPRTTAIEAMETALSDDEE